MDEKQKQVNAVGQGAKPVMQPAAPPQRLKAERVQLRVAPPSPVGVERLQQRLATLPGWRIAAGGRALTSAREFPSAGLAAAYAGYLAQLTPRAGVRVEIVVAGAQVAVAVRAGRGYRGLTEAVLSFAEAAD